MRRISALFKDSYREIKNVRCVTITAMFGAISIALGSLAIQVTESLRVSFSFLPNQFVFYLFGPIVGGVYGGAMDILTFIVKSTGIFHPGFTFNAILTGIFYGLIYYKRSISLKRIFIANVLHMIIFNFILTTYWLTHLTGSDFFVLLPPRAIKSLIMLPIETLLFYSVIKGVETTGIIKLLSGKKL